MLLSLRCVKSITIRRTRIQALTTVVGYTEIVNLLDYTSVVIPVTYADKDVDTFDEDYQPLNDKDDANWKACECLSAHLRLLKS